MWTLPPRLATAVQQLPPSQFAALVNTAFQLPPVETEFLLSQLESAAGNGNENENGLDFEQERQWRMEVHARERRNRSSGLNRSLPTPRMPPEVIHVQAGSRAAFPLRFRKAHQYIALRVALIG